MVWGAVSTIWIIILTVLLWKQSSDFKKLFPKEGQNFRDKLKEVLSEVEGLEEFKVRCLGNLQKVFLKRYNPYQDTGGDQSFSLALLNGRGDGVVVTSLHSRAGTRVFAKGVKEGMEAQVQFSQEEKEVVRRAMGQ